ncbi:hypothetical protein O6H91_16G037200 [Diphasiastrum complanatum]|uniref:Uncharacterized protein n=1 Tax=Diphasiastrum complanatum TaxID=34168 RepID=A0ACC2BBK4_DIPCM|nr:hypothetical protein O6H91_16G037200 [Diphasiastrum complanatum]
MVLFHLTFELLNFSLDSLSGLGFDGGIGTATGIGSEAEAILETQDGSGLRGPLRRGILQIGGCTFNDGQKRWDRCKQSG